MASRKRKRESTEVKIEKEESTVLGKRKRPSSEWREIKSLDVPSDTRIKKNKLINEFDCLVEQRRKCFRINNEFWDLSCGLILLRMQQIYYYFVERYPDDFVLLYMSQEVNLCPYMVRRLRCDQVHTIIEF